MSFIDFQQKHIVCKVVYYGPQGSGKTTNLDFVYARTSPPGSARPARPPSAGTTYDYLPLMLGEIRGFKTEFRLFTVAGAPDYAASRHEVLTGADGIVFVADAQRSQQELNRASAAELEQLLASHGFRLGALPRVLQLNKRDLDASIPIPELAATLPALYQDGATFEGIATMGVGVFDSLKAIAKQILTELKKGA